MSRARNKKMLKELMFELSNESSTLGMYCRALPKNEIKDLFRNEGSEFLKEAIERLKALEEYEFCAAFHELLEEKEPKS